jgi:predicted ATPase
LPTEIPDGVCFILSGQPATIYQDQYPQWLSAGTEIECIGMPKLGVSEIKQLILARADNFTDAADELANLIFQKTEGNNLSTVFAVEEIRSLFCFVLRACGSILP